MSMLSQEVSPPSDSRGVSACWEIHIVKGLSEISGENSMDASHGDSSLFGPHLNAALPMHFLLSVNYACFPLMHLGFQ